MAYGWDQDHSGDPFGDADEVSKDCASFGRVTANQEDQQHDGIEIVDLTGVDEVKLKREHEHERPKPVTPPVDKSNRNYKLEGDHRSVKHVAVYGSKYQVGHFVELRQLVGTHKIQFLEIKSIKVHNDTQDVIIRGLPYARTRSLGGCLPRKSSEVCLILEIDADDARPDEEQALLQIEPEQILKHRILTNTNRPFPDCRFDDVVYVTDEQKEHKAPLTCRWVMRAEYKDASQRRAGRLLGQALEHLSERDAHKIKKRNLGADRDRSRAWRGEPGLVKGEHEDGKPERATHGYYCFADISAGAGGASRGAVLAGLDAVLATEPCLHARGSYQANFPDAEIYDMETTELTELEDRCGVDILHISFSALSAAKDDEKAAGKLCTGLLTTFYPRVVTMDLPSSITSENKIPFFNEILSSFTKAGYSVQWKHVNMVEYGLPQMRKRVLVIATGPGEKPASWPAVTHSSDPTGDHQPLVTEEEAIGGLSRQLHSLHDPEALPVINRATRDTDKPIDYIGSNGALHDHPDGERAFTFRELASLQGFPTYHEFKGSYLKKQICTAFPPSVAMAFYQHIRQHLEEVDGVHSVSPIEHPEASNANEAMPDAIDENPALPASPRPETQQNAGPPSPVYYPTPSPSQHNPTPSTGGRFTAGQRAAALRRRRERAEFEEEEPESDGDDAEGGPETLETPSKRQRTSVGDVSDTSRTVSVSSDVEDASVYEDAEEQAGGGSRSPARRSGSYEGEV